VIWIQEQNLHGIGEKRWVGVARRLLRVEAHRPVRALPMKIPPLNTQKKWTYSPETFLKYTIYANVFTEIYNNHVYLVKSPP
jgi:hypothetical protein